MQTEKWFFAEIWFSEPGHPRTADEVIVVGKGRPQDVQRFEDKVKRSVPHAFETRVFVTE